MDQVSVPQIALVAEPPIASSDGPSARVVFSGERREFRKLVTRGALLELVTLGIYRFWLATDMRRYLWSNTSLDGDAPEYSGTAKELLIGFLFALAILGPIYLGYFLVGIEAERFKSFASTPLVLFFLVFKEFAVYRARRYRLTRTVWRGVRFWMSGSGWAYALRSALWGVLVTITAGIALPWREAALERYKMSHTFYGDLPGRFDGTGWGLFKRGWWLWLLSVIIVPLSLGLPYAPMSAPARVAAFTLAGLLLFVAGPFIYAAYKATVWRWWASGLRFGELSVESDLRRTSLIGVYWKTLGWMVLFVVAEIVIVGAALVTASKLAGGGFSVGPEVAVFARTHPLLGYVGTIANYFVIALMVGAVMRIYLLRRVWEHVASSLTIHHIEAVDGVEARGTAASALGEGFADSLDIAGF